MNKELIKQKIKELDKNNLFDLIKVHESLIYDNIIEIQLMKDFVLYSEDDYYCTASADIDYNIKNNKITINRDDDYAVYDEDYKTNSIPLLNFCYNNIDKIKAIIKECIQ